MNATTYRDSDPLDNTGGYGHWLVRFPIISVFTFMGIDKFVGGGVEEFATTSGLSVAVAGLVAIAEIAAGLLVLIGGFTNGTITRLGALAAVPVLLGAVFMVHWGQWHFMPSATHPMGGMMFQVTLLMLALYLLLRGNRL
ncbi:MAG: DoxX family protein [Lysobacter sp.]|nr:DoxX family protein [Lysobacter sp.]MDQ3269591.1 DoxX family protein [Pseudomonadota bacterium]